MSSANPTTRPAVLTIAASDSAGMAGVQMALVFNFELADAEGLT